ncbi:DUF3786 domain-containing protein [Acetobacterium paludosum]|uniref:DUF3786 domain-containing protein n=1 Tax=Acetobacterium paludosum TaxID=52693 RepID=A0A923I0T5_9FIRM|nr:DUF3786 domain-containing protein [Acetobacterium paludosum]MBC3887040.1 DUF3786 domain-containing protein [Acetobacterium paludosum]
MKQSKIQKIDPHFSESSYFVSRDLFKNHDPFEMSEKSRCSFDQKSGTFEIAVLGEKYIVHYPSGEVCNAQEENFDNYSVKIIILRYLMNAKGKENEDELISFKEFPDGPLYYSNFYKRCIQVFANIGNEMPDELKKYMNAINGIPLGKGDLSWQFTVMPGVTAAGILWFGDDEFEAEAQILFDKSLTKVFNIKDLAILGDVLIISLKTFTFSLEK